MKKIVFVNSSLSGGGSERVMTLLANRFAAEQYNVIMYLLVKQKEIYMLSPQVKRVDIAEGSGKIGMRVTRIRSMREHLIKDRPDIIISFMSQINLYTLIASIGLKAKVYVSERNNPLERSLPLKIAERILYGCCASGVVFQTDFARNCFPQFIRKKSVVIPNPIDKSEFSTPYGERKPTIVGVGRLTEQKNFSLLIQAFAEFSINNPDYTLTIYGEGDLRGQLQKEISDLNLVNKVFLPGSTGNLANAIHDAGMFVSASNYEGISNAMLEALSMGIPAVCTDCPVGGAKQTIQNNVNGILVPVGDKKEMVRAMERIAGDREFGENLSKEALEITDTYSMDRIFVAWENEISSM